MSNPRVGAWPVNPDPGSFVSQQTQIAPVRIFARDDSARERLARDHGGDINQFFDAAHRQHMLSGRGFSAQRRNVGPVEMVYLNNNGQPQVVVTPEPEVVEVPDPEVIEVPPDYTVVSRYSARIEFVNQAFLGLSTNLAYSGLGSQYETTQATWETNPPPWYGVFLQDCWSRTQNTRKPFVVETSFHSTLAALRPSRRIWAFKFFSWNILDFGIPDGIDPGSFTPNDLPFFANYLTNMWEFLPFITGTPTPVAVPEPVVVQTFPSSLRVSGIGRNLAFQDPSLAPIADWLDDRLVQFYIFPPPPLPP